VLQSLTRKRTSLIGVDFGSCSLRAAQLRGTADGWCVHHWVNIEIEPTTPDPPALEYEKELGLAFGPGTFSGRRAGLLLSPPDVDYKLLELPAAVLEKSPAEVKSALQFELERQLPWPATESEIAAWPIRPGGKGSANAMVAAARTSTVQRWLDTLDTKGLECLRADIVPNAMTRVCAPASGTGTAQSGTAMWGVLDIGFLSCRVYLIYGDRPVYARVLRGGGRELSETLAGALHTDFAVAEQYKRIYGIRRTDRGVRSMAGELARISEDELPAVLYAILRPAIEAMAKDVERACRFALGQFPEATVGPIYLIGGGARLGGLVEALSAHLGITVSLPDPERALGGGGLHNRGTDHPLCSPANYPVLAPCVGLAMMEDRW